MCKIIIPQNYQAYHLCILQLNQNYPLQMNLFFNTINTLKQYHKDFTQNTGKEDKLRTQLHSCTYTDDVKFVIQKAVKQLFHVYSYFDSDIISFTQQGMQKRFIQVKGIMELEVRGKNCKVDYNMMLPQGFPRQPPFIRIVNRNSEYNVDNFYKDCRSPTDPKSFLLNSKLTEIMNWQPSKSIVNVVMQSQQMMRNHFPFTKPKSSEVNMYGSNYHNQSNGSFSNWQTNNNNSPWQNQNPTNNYNNSQGNQGNQGWSNQPSWNQGGYSNNSKQPPIPFSQTNSNQLIVKAQKYSGNTKKSLELLKDKQIKSLQTIQQLQTLKYSIQSEEAYLRKQNFQMTKFLQNNENINIDNLSELIQPQGQLSQQILDLTSSIKARQQCITFLESRFNSGQIGFDQFLKYLRKVQQQKFEDKVLLNKCIKIAQNY